MQKEAAESLEGEAEKINQSISDLQAKAEEDLNTRTTAIEESLTAAKDELSEGMQQQAAE